jgi:hypothetical protein
MPTEYWGVKAPPAPYGPDFTPPSSNFLWELEDGSGHWLLEDGSGCWELEEGP